ncbi:MAG: hydroxyacid dehydrogenase [Paracoccaceae bacterium]
MPHLLIAGKLHPAGIAHLSTVEARGWSYTHVQSVDQNEMLAELPNADALIIRTQPLTAEIIASAPKLKFVSRHGVGYDVIDTEALSTRGIPLAIVGDVNSISAAEQAVTLMLAAAKRVNRGDQAVRSTANWEWRNALEAIEVSGKNLFLVGFGRIGQRVAQMMQGFSMTISAYDPFISATDWPSPSVKQLSSLEEGLEWAEIVSLHLPSLDHVLLGENELQRMTRGAIVINAARGGLIDEVALKEALLSGHIGAAGLDVFETEPPRADHPLASCDTAVLSPHIGGISNDAAKRMALKSIDNVLDYFADTLAPELIVNPNYSEAT